MIIKGKKRKTVNYFVDLILFLAIILLCVTGIIKYPPIQSVLSINIIDIPYAAISVIHDISGLVMLFFGTIHIILHFEWMWKTTKTIVKCGLLYQCC